MCMTKIKESKVEWESFTREKQWKYRKILNPITSDIRAALIFHKLKNWYNWQFETAQLVYDENRKITEQKQADAPKKWPVDIWWKIEDINIINVRKKAFEKIDNSDEIEEADKKRLKDWINSFIAKEFIQTRTNLESKKHLPNQKVRQYYTKLAKSLVAKWELSEADGVIYKEICLAIANILYEKNHSYLDKNWEITQKWLEYMWYIFLKTIKNIPNSWSSKSYHKIFHDWDFNFLRKENSEWEPKVWTLDHYVKAIMYLMNAFSFNAYADWWDEWANEWYKSKKSFLNNLYTTIYLKDENTKKMLSDKWVIHKELTHQRQSCKDSLGDNSTSWDLTWRLKTDASKMLKIWWRTAEIKDESWIRATYYGDMEDKIWIQSSILTLCKNYLEKICNIEWVYIESIQADMKWEFITKEMEAEIIKELWEYISEIQSDNINISERTRVWGKKSKLESISGIYRNLTGRKPWEGLQSAYKITSGEVKRWANWKYEDFKLIVKLSVNKDEFNEWSENDEIEDNVSIFQEISFYPHDNDLWIGNHNFLDLEKRIFNRVKNMNDSELWKSISLNRLRYFTEAAIKDISFDIDIYEDKIRRGILPEPKSYDYKYLQLDGKKIPLDRLIARTENNTDRFDELIPLILNYFLKRNKIFYINREDDGFHWLITKQQLHNKRAYKIRRFSTSDTLRNTALDTNNEWYNISFYTDEEKQFWYPNFYSVNLWDLGDFIRLEKLTKQ